MLLEGDLCWPHMRMHRGAPALQNSSGTGERDLGPEHPCNWMLLSCLLQRNLPATAQLPLVSISQRQLRSRPGNSYFSGSPKTLEQYYGSLREALVLPFSAQGLQGCHDEDLKPAPAVHNQLELQAGEGWVSWQKEPWSSHGFLSMPPPSPLGKDI